MQYLFRKSFHSPQVVTAGPFMTKNVYFSKCLTESTPLLLLAMTALSEMGAACRLLIRAVSVVNVIITFSLMGALGGPISGLVDMMRKSVVASTLQNGCAIVIVTVFWLCSKK
jgi:hypothetical protein